MAERELNIPRVGRLVARPSFRIVAAMNPFDNIGTTRVSASIYDRLCRMAVGYQTEAEEQDIVALRTGAPDGRLVHLGVSAARATRDHPELRVGASVRGAIDLVLVAQQLSLLANGNDPSSPSVVREAAPWRFRARSPWTRPPPRTPEEVILEIVEHLL
jgi:MoxR-like ATPase